MLHRMRIFKSEGGCVVRCTETNSVANATHHLGAMMKLNAVCGCKHRKEYDAEETMRLTQHKAGQYSPSNSTKLTERYSVEQLNARINWR